MLEGAEDSLSAVGLSRRSAMALAPLAAAGALPAEQAWAWPFEGFKRLQNIQYLAALGDPDASSGSGAQSWGLWRVDPGPRGVMLRSYPALKARDGVAPANWKFDDGDWWLEEHGLIMEKPDFPMPAGRYVVTGAREVTTILTVTPEGRWSLEKGKLYDVTHLPCRSARYTPASGGACTPEQATQSAFPVTPGAPMPPVMGCNKQDYAVLFVIGVEA